MIEGVVVVGVVVAALAYLGRRAVRTLRGEASVCAGGCRACPAGEVANELERAARRAGCAPDAS